uniref:OTU domain-containing protein n=1 Tax=Biomphalaria glabrata TaxID=6526 RepID=A0A2C9KFG4_BIOGL
MSLSQITTITKHPDMTPSLEITSTPTTSLPITFTQLEKEMIKQKRLTIKIVADGNCLFRTISQIIFLTEDQHRNIRKHVTSFMITHEENFEMFVDGDCKSSIWKQETTWATTAEMLAAATLLQRDIYTFSPNHKKTKYSWLLLEPLFHDANSYILSHTDNYICCNITLLHINGNHFDVVVPQEATCNCYFAKLHFGV